MDETATSGAQLYYLREFDLESSAILTVRHLQGFTFSTLRN